jgi:hypothetical protein
MRYVYKRRGGPLVSYEGGIPVLEKSGALREVADYSPDTVRAATTRGLGSLGAAEELGNLGDAIDYPYRVRGNVSPFFGWRQAAARDVGGLGHTEYAYQRRGGPLYEYDGDRPPNQAGVATSVGAEQMPDESEEDLVQNYEYVSQPPGSPEELTGIGDDGSMSIFDRVRSPSGRTLVAAAAAFHGYRRSGKVLLALGWGLLGYLFPVATPVVAVAQGFGKRPPQAGG